MKNHCENCKNYVFETGSENDGYDVTDESYCEKRYDETMDKISDPTYKAVPKRCFESKSK